LVAELSVLLGRHRVIQDAPVGMLDRVHDLINDDLTADLTLEALSLAAGLSRFQLHRGFFKRFGLAPHAYILQQRVAEARRLIKAGVSLAEAAASSGFCDQSHLSRVFAKQVGVSPGQYASPAHIDPIQARRLES
jgi:AraC-like DNA-binding protein